MIVQPEYTPALWGLFVILVTLLVQWFVASGVKSTRPGAVPGKIDDQLSHGDFVFRAHRTFLNSLENISLMLGTVLLALLVGTHPLFTAVFIWLFALARIIHMALYYLIATERNPSPRSYFFMLGLAANVGLLALAGVTLAT